MSLWLRMLLQRVKYIDCGDVGVTTRLLQKDDKSLRRMIGRNGNPTSKNFIELLHACQQEENIRFEVRVVRQ